MRKHLVSALLGIVLLLGLAGCGAKSQEDVVKALDEKMDEVSSYQATAKLTLKTGAEPQVYDVEIWYKQPHYYRVSLKNDEKNQNQMILRNDEGVFVITPALNKSFRFQSDWPKNTSQAYLYESLVKDILSDKKASFKAKGDHYVFETKTNYPNSQVIPKQEITLNKKDLAPVSVKVMDTDMKALLTVQFSKIEFNKKFDKNAFDTTKNMTGARLEVPTMAKGENEAAEVMYPINMPTGVEQIDEKEIATKDGKRVIMTFGGKKSFTLIQEAAQALPTFGSSALVNGEPVDLGFAIGALTDHSLTWTYKGIEFMIASEDLTKDEMVMIAQSVQGKEAK
ncbi:putative sporulation protein ydcC [Anoxybacillus sp. B7M1]|jgi:outer membrane lipoprotein-sorting protein|uniref:Outer membrane lipoprotein carrier protein LolA n=1 Tax=Anoxybacteroides rupiense TaxID=311460 RepID=A0ABD5IY14_9BACL|nr:MULTISPECIES: outer membrane lipoprotein carrier protein LolA [Anoxybacillus]ANB59018.1 putative sporulation protein ydcC [Anoxybacillus sp. B2M1]ANB62480.1 putative sporulation protein ydcC [Anoxybacillus sp. B7M1]KXG09541.1 Sporulation protein YdcC [Anoxybacillus sp. P3H1B]MBB3908903.1 outer membrane lipoprotein-sorting protein [Anoxybacillus rupiensis]MBS2771867.1 outer membrane lipoprotein carrier protein LolA [Anoxybacillus rupiensis]